MDLGDIRTNKLVSLALQGYNSFSPDLGILCGGYQGPLYPNPTTLTYPGFDPYLYVNPAMSRYTPNASYAGLGPGNPGINYTNPGHILGLLDTFGRMSYGLALWRAVYNGSDFDGSVSPAVNVQIPMIGLEDDSATLSMSDIYPSLAEVPTDWLSSVEVESDGEVVPDPRRMAAFVTVPLHEQDFTRIDDTQFNRLFADKTVLSYIGMPQYLRAVIASMSSYASAMDGKVEMDFSLPDTEAADFNKYSHQDSWHDNVPTGYHGTRDSEGKVFMECKSLSPSQALNALTGSDSYHNGQDGMNEYRSLTELNSVINVMPAQMIGAQFWTDTKGFKAQWSPITGWVYYVGPETGRTFTYASYMIVDFTINVSDIPIDPDDPEPGQVTIVGEATVKSPISDPTAYYYHESSTWYYSPAHIPPHDPVEENSFDYGCTQSLKKNVDIQMSMKNQYGWDSVWLGGGPASDTYSETDEFEDVVTDGGVVPGVGFITCDQSDLVVPFSHTFTMGAGCTAIRMRAFIRNRHEIGMMPGILFDPWNPGPTSPGPGIQYIVTDSGPTGSPDSVPDTLVSSNVAVSFTVTGTRMDSLSYDFSI